jgi:hypothetical protein
VISVLIVLGLAPQLSAAVVAFTIEADNEFEQQVEHITTRHGGSGERGLRMSTNLDGMRRWVTSRSTGASASDDAGARGR